MSNGLKKNEKVPPHDKEMYLIHRDKTKQKFN